MNVLQGKVAGNRCPIHPSLVNGPLLLYPLSALARLLGTQPNLIAKLSGLRAGNLFAGAHYLNILALLITIPAALTGYAEYKTIAASNGPAKATVNKHMALNVSVSLIGVYLWWSLRSSPFFEPQTHHVVLGLLAAALLIYSGRLGGKLVYEHGVGVKRQ